MPNHCSNRVTVTGPKRLVLAFIKKAASDKEPLDFNRLVPMPDELRATKAPADDTPETARLKAKYGFADWYEWACANWGTKWGAYDHEDQKWCTSLNKRGPVESSLYYTTAWSPATPFWQEVSRQNPKLTFRHEFAEGGCGFVGAETFQNGEMVSSDDFPWDSEAGKELAASFGYEDEN